MSLKTETLYNDGKISALRLLEDAGHNPVVAFNIDIGGANPRKELVVYINGDPVKVEGSFTTCPDGHAFYHTAKTGKIYFRELELRSGTLLVLENWRSLSDAQAQKAKVEIAARGGL